MTIDREKDGLMRELVSIEKQIAELKSVQFSGSSNNSSGKTITSNEFIFTPSTSWNLEKGFLVRISGDNVSLATMILDVRRADDNQPWTSGSAPTIFRRGWRFTTLLNGKYESWFYYWDYAQEYPVLKIKATAIVNNTATVVVEGVQNAY